MFLELGKVESEEGNEEVNDVVEYFRKKEQEWKELKKREEEKEKGKGKEKETEKEKIR